MLRANNQCKCVEGTSKNMKNVGVTSATWTVWIYDGLKKK